MLTREQIKSIKKPGVILPNGIFIERGAKMKNYGIENRASRRYTSPKDSNNRKGLKRVIVAGKTNNKVYRVKQFVDSKLIVHYL